MKFASFEHRGIATYGVFNEDRLVDLGVRLRERAPDLRALIALGLLHEASSLAASVRETIDAREVRFLPVIPTPELIVCVGLNYADHVRETGREVGQPAQAPTVFLRAASSQVGHGQDILLPPESIALDFEGEIALIIGKGGRRISPANAWDHVCGYACYNDASVRDWQSATSQWTPGKNFWRTGAFGPWMVTADNIRPGQAMTLITRLNGVEMQRSTTDLLIHDIPSLIAYVSTFAPLAPGDVIVTGTPGGVGFKRDPPIYLRHGDVVEVEVDAIGILRNRVAAEPAG
ncbi:fumarylacetoacetate hydrolase family protein [Acidovorax sp. SUPP2522]|uniref:fumarylacetoacetate hydrolase family protein n=1 Tax=unclassified Acidovorax TaxID=2684926 RepID=UPI00234A93E9|nr:MULTISPECIES: fumarylacetoacetate hydrolase family protein [unclassified Acidovorax]WCM99629.1 fumarylacetoacetate hydrolase family protein [Acidovorax sp. GBBC 1281]GKT19077.1 fumarylacetoacetate hydrolase family protein [Acidovorax sp. SUPP2522]